jgi:hypothetical protein
MSDRESQFLYRLRDRLRGEGDVRVGSDKRHPLRNSTGYDAIKWQAAGEIEALCERIVREIENGIADIDDVVAPIAAPLAEQLAKGAISDVFEAAAEVLKAQIREGAKPPPRA